MLKKGKESFAWHSQEEVRITPHGTYFNTQTNSSFTTITINSLSYAIFYLSYLDVHTINLRVALLPVYKYICILFAQSFFVL